MSGDVLRTLAEARPAELHPEAPVDAATREAELARAMATPPGGEAERAGRAGPVPVRRRRSRPVWGLSLAATAAAAAVVAAFVVAPDGTDGAGGPIAGGAPDSENVPMDARTVLLAAAERADEQPNRTGGFWHTKTVHRLYLRVGAAGDEYTIVRSSSDEAWVPSGTGGKVWNRHQELGARPVGPADKAAWRRAGSPAKFDVRLPIAPGREVLKKGVFPGAAGRPTLTGEAVEDVGGKGGALFWLGRNVTVKELRALPPDPARLKADLMRWYGGHDTETKGRRMGSSEWLFRVAANLVNGQLPVTPEVRAGAFRMLAGLDSVRAVGTVKDAEGRPGAAIAATARTGKGVLENRLIIDPATGNALGEETVLVTPAGGNANRPAGSLLNSTAVITMEWTDSSPG